jgi:hypothetical protein
MLSKNLIWKAIGSRPKNGSHLRAFFSTRTAETAFNQGARRASFQIPKALVPAVWINLKKGIENCFLKGIKKLLHLLLSMPENGLCVNIDANTQGYNRRITTAVDPWILIPWGKIPQPWGLFPWFWLDCLVAGPLTGG